MAVNSSVVYVGGYSTIYRSTDGGTTFKPTFSYPGRGTMNALWIELGNTAHVIAAWGSSLSQTINSGFPPSYYVAAAQQIMQMADKSILQLGAQYQGEKPPDRLYPVIYAALQVERVLGLVGGSSEINPKVTTWAEVIRDYYLDQLKTNHDYRAFPILLSLEKSTELLGGTDRLADILSAMTFEVVVDTSFDAKWVYGEADDYQSGHVEQTADVKHLKNELNPPDFLWGTASDLILKYTKGTFTSHTPAVSGTFPLDLGQSYTGDLWLKNWDACVTKTFDVMFSDFEGIGETFTGFNGAMPVAGTGSRVGFEQYLWGLAGYMFTIPMQNLNPTLGDKSFSGSGSKGGGDMTGSAQIHIVIKHTPQ